MEGCQSRVVSLCEAVDLGPRSSVVIPVSFPVVSSVGNHYYREADLSVVTCLIGLERDGPRIVLGEFLIQCDFVDSVIPPPSLFI